MTTDAIEKPAKAEVTHREHTRNVRHYRPNVDIVERAGELTVYADMPGATVDGIDVNFENGTLTIHGKVEPRRKDDVNYLLSEYGVGDFYRTFEVSETIDSENITAEYADGVLVLHLPKVQAAKPRKIAVKTG
jgi:HSP20 family molecular chaperone IbpA